MVYSTLDDYISIATAVVTRDYLFNKIETKYI